MAYLQTGYALNRAWERMNNALLNVDFRSLYLKAFEAALSPCLIDSPLQLRPDYLEQSKKHPLPVSPYDIMPMEEYLSWMTVYEAIMRNTGILLGPANKSDEDDSEDAIQDYMIDNDKKGGKSNDL
ncbi:MAG: hypothetical protein WCR24_06955 [Candidatus Methanomethylophilaceae archaeon]